MNAHFFNVRVYGIMICKNHVLITHETIKDTFATKFPGGGLEFGEGTIDCLKREFMEELGMEIHQVQHFYTTDIFVQSAFKETDQIISIYYLASPLHIFETLPVLISKEKNMQSFEWRQIELLNPDHFYFPIDKIVVNQLLEMQ